MYTAYFAFRQLIIVLKSCKFIVNTFFLYNVLFQHVCGRTSAVCYLQTITFLNSITFNFLNQGDEGKAVLSLSSFSKVGRVRKVCGCPFLFHASSLL